MIGRYTSSYEYDFLGKADSGQAVTGEGRVSYGGSFKCSGKEKKEKKKKVS